MDALPRTVRLTLIAIAALPLMSQQEPVIRVSVDLVQVDAVVTDSRGRHIPDLKADDFRIFEDGKLQKITHFAYVRAAQGVNQAPLPSVARKRGSRTREEVPLVSSKGLREDQVARNIVIVVDDLGLAADEIPRIREVMKNFVDHQMQPGDLASIMTTSGGSGLAEQFTDDKRALHALIGKIHFAAARSGLTWYNPVHMAEPGLPVDANAARLNAFRADYFATGTQAVLREAIAGLHDMPGRKAIALFSDGFLQSVDRTVELANRASVVFYTFDARGLVTFNMSALDTIYPERTAQNIAPFENRRERSFYASEGSLRLLANLTGGTFLHDDNDLSAGLGNALEDMSSYYLIGYQPKREDFDRVRGAVQYHKIKVKVRRPNLTVRSRQGFSGQPDPVNDTLPRTGQSDLLSALESPFRSTGLPVYLRAFTSVSREEQTGKLQATLRALVLIDVRGVEPEQLADGKRRLNLSILSGIRGDDDQPVANIDRSYTIEKTAEEMRQCISQGLGIEIDLPAQRAGGYQLRAAVRDSQSGKIGAAREFIEIPDFNENRVSLSSVLISDADPARAALLDRAGVFAGGSAVTRVFAPGAVLDYDCEIFGAAKPELEVRLFRGKERIFTGNRLTVASHAVGQIKLPPTLPPGDYALAIVAYDGAKPKATPGERWVDFTLFNPQAQ